MELNTILDYKFNIMGALLGILVFGLVFRKWKKIGLIEWAGGFLFFGAIGSTLVWVWDILPADQRQTYAVFLVVGVVGLIMLHLGDVISAFIRHHVSGCGILALILVGMALVFVTEPFTHGMQTAVDNVVNWYSQLVDQYNNLDAEYDHKTWMIPVGVIFAILAIGVIRSRRGLEKALDEFMNGSHPVSSCIGTDCKFHSKTPVKPTDGKDPKFDRASHVSRFPAQAKDPDLERAYADRKAFRERSEHPEGVTGTEIS